MRKTRQVALLIEATHAYARGLLHGIAQYELEHADWNVYFQPYALEPDLPPPKWLKNWRGDGMLTRIENREVANTVTSLKVPIVDLRRVMAFPDVPSIGPDNEAVARLAVEHLRERGFQHFGFCGFPAGLDPHMDDRETAFCRYLEQAGLRCDVFQADPPGTWRQEEERAGEWIRSLPKPVGIMAAEDNRGLMVLRACVNVGVAVPEEVAVIGAGNDDCLCTLSHPQLSSVDLAPEAIGYEAAALLERLMSGQRPRQRDIQFPPRGIITRLSTDVLATKDQAVAKAMRFIRTQACAGIHVQDVLRHVMLSRSALEPRLKQVLGRTIHQEIHRVRLERAKVLLATTDLPAKQIAVEAGFRYVQYLGIVFRQATGQTPASYRKRMRR